MKSANHNIQQEHGFQSNWGTTNSNKSLAIFRSFCNCLQLESCYVSWASKWPHRISWNQLQRWAFCDQTNLRHLEKFQESNRPGLFYLSTTRRGGDSSINLLLQFLVEVPPPPQKYKTTFLVISWGHKSWHVYIITVICGNIHHCIPFWCLCRSFGKLFPLASWASNQPHSMMISLISCTKTKLPADTLRGFPAFFQKRWWNVRMKSLSSFATWFCNKTPTHRLCGGKMQR